MIRCWLGWHDTDPILRRRRDNYGRAIPHVIDWECRRCGSTIGVTEQKPSWRVLAILRRQAARRKQAA